MKDLKLLTFPVLMILAAFFAATSFLGGTAMAMGEMEQLTVTVEIYSGRPNPTFEITDAAAIVRLRESLRALPSTEVTDVEKAGFSRLGYRGIVITNPTGIDGIPETLQLHDGKVKIPGIRGEDAGFFSDTAKLEKHYLGLAKQKGLITELLNAQMIPDPGDL